jgi:hypothetical protein
MDLQQALQYCLGQDAILDHPGMERFLLYIRRHGVSDLYRNHKDEAWSALAESIVMEILKPPMPCTIGKGDIISRLNKAVSALEAAALAIRNLEAIGIDTSSDTAWLSNRAAHIAKLATIVTTIAPNGSRHHQGDSQQYSLARRLHAALGHFLGDPEHGYTAALAGLIEAITGRECKPLYVARWLNPSE